MSGKTASFDVASDVDASPAQVWARVTTPEGINGELMPIVRMTLPRGLASLDPASVPIGEPLGRCWLLLFGFLPFDYDDLMLVRLEEEVGFHERSTMLSQRVWEHERTLEPLAGGGCRVTDRITFEPRLPLPARFLRPVFRFVFRHRHRRLRRFFGGLDS